MDYFKNLLELLKNERQEDQKNYLEQTESNTAADRRAAGLTWYPIALKNTELAKGDYLIIEIERTTHQEVQHQFRFGSSVRFFSNTRPDRDQVEGTVSFSAGNLMRVTLKADELPNWAKNGKLGLDLLFDNNSYNEMEKALKQAIKISEGKLPGPKRLIEVLVGERKPSFVEDKLTLPLIELNTRQKYAAVRILQAKDLAIVHGPPGTGKTTTIVQTIKAMWAKHGRQILVVAPSNAAVDLLSERLDEAGLEILRLGNPARVSKKMLDLTIDSKLQSHEGFKQIKALKKQAASYKDMGHKYKRSFGRAEQDQRRALFSEAQKVMKEAEQSEKYLTDQILANAEVITCTLVGASHYLLKDRNFHTLVIDEAAQALEPACWIPILKAEKVVFAGDHCQLPPTIKSRTAAQGLSRTLMEKLSEEWTESVVMLEEQYRMHPSIMAYPSSIFYDSMLKANHCVATRLLFPMDSSLCFVDTAGCGFEEKPEGTSTTNPEEAAFLLKHLAQYIGKLQPHYTTVNFPSIGIIAPYQQQIIVLKDLLLASENLVSFAEHITIQTVDSFQGQERDVIYVGLTRSNSRQQIGFLADIRRMNVAMTRAKQKLVVIGDSSTISAHPFYDGFINYAEQQKVYQSAWEYI